MNRLCSDPCPRTYQLHLTDVPRIAHVRTTHFPRMCHASIRDSTHPFLKVMCIENAVGRPILSGWVKDRTLYPYQQAVGFCARRGSHSAATSTCVDAVKRAQRSQVPWKDWIQRPRGSQVMRRTFLLITSSLNRKRFSCRCMWSVLACVTQLNTK